MAVSPGEQQLRQFKVEFLRACQRKDRAALEGMIHDDFTLVDPSGNEVSKTELINDIVHNQSDFLREFNRSDRATAFHVDGNVARETASVRMSGRHARHGDISGEYVNTATYVRTPQGWRMIGNSLHRAPAGAAAPAAAAGGWSVSIVGGEIRAPGQEGRQ